MIIPYLPLQQKAPDILPDLVVVPLVGTVVDLLTCDECRSVYRESDNACDHGHDLCPTCWPGWCKDCADLASDMADADLADAMRDDARLEDRGVAG